MTTSWPPGESDDDSASAASPSSTPLADAPESDVTDVGPEPSDQLSNAHPEPGQPGFQYDQEQPSPPQNITKTVTPAPTQAAPAPPTPPSQDTSNSGTGLDGSGPDGGDGNTQPPPQPQDSLSLAQLRRVLAEFPRTEPVAYDYVYTDTGPIEEEVDEWFTYHFWQWVRLNTAHRAFESAWNASAPDAAFHAGAAEVQRWEEADEDLRRSFVRQLLGGIKPADRSRPRSEAIGALVYLVLGRWEETLAGATLPSPADPKVRSMATRAQLDAMKAGVLLLAECDGLPIIWEALTSTSDLFW